ncbi:MAG: hypothetical protein JNL01_00455 [Bdellovibrionales bacterium]|nr:hypothetical protein [Bdellovibrionales bacterium]
MKIQLCISIAKKAGSFGTTFHNALYSEMNLPFVYQAFSTQDGRKAVQSVRKLSIRGCSVTMPFKSKVIPELDALDPIAKSVQAVNTIVNQGGKLKGYNTDYFSAKVCFKRFKRFRKDHWVIFGAGGIARTCAKALIDLGYVDPSHLTILARDPKQARKLAQILGCKTAAKLPPQTTVFINATPETRIRKLPISTGKQIRAVGDYVVVLPKLGKPTPLIRWAQTKKLPCISGLDLAIPQAIQQFRLYTGKKPTPQALKKALSML